MTVLWIIIGLVIAAGLYWLYKRYQSRKKSRSELAAAWAKPKNRDHNWGQVRYYFDLFKRKTQRPFVDDNTWDDLNFDAIFGLLDRTESNIGQQVLYNLLRRPLYDRKLLVQREEWIQMFANRADLRLDMQMQLQKLTGFSVWKLSNILFEELPQFPRWFYALLMIPLLSILFIGLGILVNPVYFLALAALFILNTIIRYFTGKYIVRYTTGMSALASFLSVVEQMGKIDNLRGQALDEFGKQFRAAYDKIKKLKKRAGNVLKKQDPNNMGSLLVEYVNTMFMARLIMFMFSVRTITRHQQTLQQLYHDLGYIDALISAASFRQERKKQLCTPEITESASQIKYQEMTHPLLDEPVPNTVEVGSKGMLVTGSNMSGKSTFLKTLGVNQILAQTLNICCAESARLPFCSVISSMRREDRITEGKSFYLTEVERVKTLIDQADGDDGHHLFLLDEIFRGTNTIERVAASLEVLRWLNRPRNFVLASTHDLELVELLDKEYTFCHFAEEVKGQTLHFDYKLKVGPSSTRNAIKLLEINQYPPQIIKGAMEAAKELEHHGVINFHHDHMTKK